MNLLFIHQNFPGQFRHLAQDFAGQTGHRVVAIGRDTAPGIPGIELVRYQPQRTGSPQTHPYLQSFETAVLHGQQVVRVLQKLRSQGFRPDVIIGHPAWGETLYVKDVYPDVPLVHFCEFYYQPRGADAGFDPEFPSLLDDDCRIKTRNALHLLNLQQCDVAVSPTRWQRSLHPKPYQQKILVVHEGVPVHSLRPDADACLALPSGQELKAGQPIVTYVARNLEPYRGFHSFMRALPKILHEHASAQIVIVGGDEVSYGRMPRKFSSWRERMLNEVAIDPSRVHFLGRIPYDTYRRVLQVSAAHVYLTYPFVLSWSMLEAMASECLIIGSDTAPVREVIRDGENGYLVNFFDADGIADRVLQSLNSPQAQTRLRACARDTAANFSIEAGLAGYRQIITKTLAGRGSNPIYLKQPSSHFA